MTLWLADLTVCRGRLAVSFVRRCCLPGLRRGSRGRRDGRRTGGVKLLGLGVLPGASPAQSRRTGGQFGLTPGMSCSRFTGTVVAGSFHLTFLCFGLCRASAINL